MSESRTAWCPWCGADCDPTEPHEHVAKDVELTGLSVPTIDAMERNREVFDVLLRHWLRARDS